jgi:ABC-type Fe3+/spermidine/putrescine transport system ATPase subunit
MIKIENLCYSVGTFSLRSISLTVARGEYFVLLGPSGAGKTLFLESICGLNRIDSGRIEINGSDATFFQPRHRRIGYVPQDYALFPHLSVRENVAFGLRRSGAQAVEIRETVEDLLDRFGLAPLASRSPGRLSGGEKQRTALARAIACRPDLLLLDEPVSALDELTRDAICSDLKTVQKQTGVTTIHVCHNFAEMLSVADRVGVIDSGLLRQVDSPEQLLRRPKTAEIARFVQTENLLPVKLLDHGGRLRVQLVPGLDIDLDSTGSFAQAEKAVLAVRPESFKILTSEDTEPSDRWTLSGTVCKIVDQAALVLIEVEVAQSIRFKISLGKQAFREARLSNGDLVRFSVGLDDLHLIGG